MLDRILKLFPFGVVAGMVLIFLLLEVYSADGFFFFYIPLAMIAGVVLFFDDLQ